MERDDVSKDEKEKLTDFNSHAHVERDVAAFALTMVILNFNSHAHVERDQLSGRNCSCVHISTHTLTWSVTSSLHGRCKSQDYFNSHAHVERDPEHLRPHQREVHFNSHAHVERDYKMAPRDGVEVNFNSHAHVERDVLNLGLTNAQNISTHTLTWSVTDGSLSSRS